MRNYLQISGLFILLCIFSSFYIPAGRKKDERRWANVDVTVYNRNGKVIDVKLDVHYSPKDSILDLYDFRGNLKAVNKGKKYKIKAYNVEKLEFKLFGKKHTFYSHTDKLQRLYYFFHAENQGDLILLKRKVVIPDGFGGMPGASQPSLPLVVNIGTEYYNYSLIRSDDKYITDIEDGRLALTLEKYFANCPELIKKMDNGDFNVKENGEMTRMVEKYHRIVEYYNETCGNNTSK